MKVSVGLWGLQSPWLRPASFGFRSKELLEDASLVEEAGFSGIWLSEHRLWYDGYDPAPLQTAARILIRTERLRVGTAVMLLPQHHPITVAERSFFLSRMSGGRFDLGVGLGYRNLEFDALGIERARRGSIMEACLATLRSRWTAHLVGSSAGSGLSVPALFVGATARRSIERAGRHGAGLILPGGWEPEQVVVALSQYRSASPEGAPPPEVALIRHCWVTESTIEKAAVVEGLVRLLHQQYGGMSQLDGGTPTHPGVSDPLGEISVGAPSAVIESIEDFKSAGVNHLIARIHNPYLPTHMVRRAIGDFAANVLPKVVA